MGIKTSHWGLKVLGALPTISILAVTYLTRDVDVNGEAVLMCSIIFTFSSILSGILLWRAATKLENHNL